MPTAFNTINHSWIFVDDVSQLPPPVSNWIISPTFVDVDRAQELGPRFWVFESNNVIRPMTDEEIDTNPVFVEEAKELKRQEINEMRDSHAFSYFPFDGKVWDSDIKSRLNIIGINTLILINGGQLPPGVVWRDYNNVDHPVNAQYMVNMGLTMFNFISMSYRAGWQHKANVDALTRQSDVENYVFTTSLWPPRE